MWNWLEILQCKQRTDTSKQIGFWTKNLFCTGYPAHSLTYSNLVLVAKQFTYRCKSTYYNHSNTSSCLPDCEWVQFVITFSPFFLWNSTFQICFWCLIVKMQSLKAQMQTICRTQTISHKIQFASVLHIIIGKGNAKLTISQVFLFPWQWKHDHETNHIDSKIH